MKSKCYSSSDTTRETIWVSIPKLSSKIRMTIEIPNDRYAEDYIDELIDSIFNEDIIYDIDWDFI